MKKYEAPELNFIGQADELVMGVGTTGPELPLHSAPDFEFEED